MASFLQSKHLAQMEKDAMRLELCTTEVRSRLISEDFSRPAQQRISKGQDAAERCIQWYEHH